MYVSKPVKVRMVKKTVTAAAVSYHMYWYGGGNDDGDGGGGDGGGDEHTCKPEEVVNVPDRRNLRFPLMGLGPHH